MTKYYHVHKGIKKSRKLHKKLALFSVAAIAGVSGLFFYINKELAYQNVSNDQTAWLSYTGEEVAEAESQIPWPTYGQAAYGIPEQNVYATSKTGSDAVPIASLAKVITALAVLEKAPLESGEPGLVITLTPNDEQLFNEYLQKDGVVLPVQPGAQISQYQALQASLLVSANNITDTLVISTFGSVEEYVEYANNMLKNLGLEKTVVADASGFSPNSVSTPEEMAKLGYLYMQSPILREIALQQNAEFPTIGTIGNANSFANTEDTIGIKIGYTDEAGRTYMAAKINKDDSEKENISIAVVLGADNLATAAKDAIAVLQASEKTAKTNQKP